MRQVIYAMQFSGKGAPTDRENVLQAATSSPSSRIMSRVGPNGLESSIEEADGDPASFESEVTLTGDTSFTETGKVTFGSGNSFRFSTIGEGYLAPSPEEGLNHGSVMWRVDSGEGQFAGASGIITSNFTFSADGEVTDNQFGVLWVE
ncbi:MAG: hypothetical protein ACOC9Y_10445 [Chloroflexota bacterium]